MSHFTFNPDDPRVPLRHVWSHAVGSRHATLALRADRQRRMLCTREEPVIRPVRYHRILRDPLSIYRVRRDMDVYSFFNADRVSDFLLGIGVRPFVELRFMPRAPSSGDTAVFSYAANAGPPWMQP